MQPVGLKVKVWGPLQGRVELLQRIDALKTGIMVTEPILLEPELVVEEEARLLCTMQAILVSQTDRDALGPVLNRLLNQDHGQPRIRAKWWPERPD